VGRPGFHSQDTVPARTQSGTGTGAGTPGPRMGDRLSHWDEGVEGADRPGPKGEGSREAQIGAALAALVPGYTHDLNNILGGIVIIVDALARSPAFRGDDHDDLVEVLEGARRAQALSLRLAACARPGLDAAGPVDLGPVLKDAARMMKKVFRGSVEVEPGAPPARGPRSSLERLAALLLHSLGAAPGLAATATLTVRAGPGLTVEVQVLPGPEDDRARLADLPTPGLRAELDGLGATLLRSGGGWAVRIPAS